MGEIINGLFGVIFGFGMTAILVFMIVYIRHIIWVMWLLLKRTWSLLGSIVNVIGGTISIVVLLLRFLWLIIEAKWYRLMSWVFQSVDN